MVILLGVIVLKFPTDMVWHTIYTWIQNGTISRMSPNLIPFKTIVAYASNVQAVYDWFFKNLACNILMFIPFGLLLPWFAKRKKARHIIVSGLIVSVLIEIFQYATALGVCDVDDVILNTLGVAIGYGIYAIIWHVFKSKSATFH